VLVVFYQRGLSVTYFKPTLGALYPLAFIGPVISTPSTLLGAMISPTGELIPARCMIGLASVLFAGLSARMTTVNDNCDYDLDDPPVGLYDFAMQVNFLLDVFVRERELAHERDQRNFPKRMRLSTWEFEFHNWIRQRLNCED
jgi:hypothetical protein